MVAPTITSSTRNPHVHSKVKNIPGMIYFLNSHKVINLFLKIYNNTEKKRLFRNRSSVRAFFLSLFFNGGYIILHLLKIVIFREAQAHIKENRTVPFSFTHFLLFSFINY